MPGRPDRCWRRGSAGPGGAELPGRAGRSGTAAPSRTMLAGDLLAASTGPAAWPRATLLAPAGSPGLDRALRRWRPGCGDCRRQRRSTAGSGPGSGWCAPVTRSGPASSTCSATPARWALWVRGSADLRFACLRSVSIVGTRAATAYGEHVCAELAAALAERGWAVVSGGAFGIDGWAHRGALGAEGITIAVLACGLDATLPAGPRRAVPGHRRARRAGQRVAAGPDADHGPGSWSATG